MKGPSQPAASPGRLGGYFHRHPSLTACLIFSALTLIFFSPRLRGDFMFRDVYHEFLGLRLLWAWARTGQMPLWDPYVALGTPLSGSVYFGLFYPVNWLLSVALGLPPGAAIKAYVLVHFALAGAGMMLMLIRLKTGGPGATVGAIAYSFCGLAVSQHYAINLLPTLALLPWAAGMMVRSGGEGSIRPAVAGGLVTSLILLGGDPQGWALSMLICITMAVMTGAGPGPRAWREVAGIVLVYLAAAVVGAAAELVPMVTVVGETARGRGFNFETATCWSLAPPRIIELVLSRPFGDPWPVDRWWGAFLGERCFPWPLTLSLYLGAVTALGWGGAWRLGGWRRDRRVLVFTVLTGGFLVLSMGRNAPLYGMFFHALPWFRSFRYPEKYMLISSFALAALAGLGIDRLSPRNEKELSQNGHRPLPVLVPPFAALAATVMVFIVFRAGSGPIARLIAPLLGGAPTAVLPADAARDLGAALTRSGFFVTVGLIVMAAVRTGKSRVIAFAPALILFLDLWQANSMLAPTAPGLYKMESHLARTIMQREGTATTGPYSFRIFRDPRILAPADLTYERMRRWERDTLRSNLGMIEGFEEFSGQNIGASARFAGMMEKVVTFERLALFSVKYAIVPEDRADDLESVGTVVERYRGAALVELSGVFPRAYWVGASRRVRGEDELASVYPGHDFRRSVLVEADKPVMLPNDSLVHNPQLLAQTITRRGLNQVEVQVKAPAPGWLVLNDAWYPGWTAAVDNHATVIYCANGLVRAVHVDAGEHNAVFTYRPPGLAGGMIISGLVWVVGIILVFFRKGGPGNGRIPVPGPLSG